MKVHGRYLNVLLAFATASSWLLAAVGILEAMKRAGSWPTTLTAIGLLVFAPLLVQRVVHARERGFMSAAWALTCLLAVFACIQTSDLGVLGLFILLAGFCYLNCERDSWALACVSLPALLVGVGLSAVNSPILLLSLPPAVLIAVVGAILLHARTTAGRVRRRSASRRGVDDAPGEMARLRLALPLGFAVMLVALVSFLTLDQLVSGDADDSSETNKQAAGVEETEESLERKGKLSMRSYQSELSFSGVGAGAVSDEVVMYARPTQILGRAELAPPTRRELFLVGATLEYFTDSTVTLAPELEMFEFTDEGDGERDGWSSLRSGAARSKLTGLDVQFVVPMRGGASDTVILTPRGTTAVSLPQLFGDDERYLLAPDDPQRYQLAFDPREIQESQLGGAEVARVQSRYWQLPSGSSSLTHIRSLAREVAAGATGDLERVLAIRNHLRDTFEYDLEGTGFGGTEAIAKFLDRGTGFCTYSAAAMALMLRTLGIPARIVTGFVSREWSAEESSWIVRRRNGHAWVEVPFAGFGWVRFDPTPIARGRGDWTASVDDALSRFQRELAAWAESGGEDVSLSTLLASLTQVPLQVLGGRPSVLFLIVGVFLAALSWLRSRLRLRSEGGAESWLPALRPPGLQARLLRALSALGHRRPRGQTPREFARELHARDTELFAPLPAIVENYYRAHFGASALASEEEAEVESFIGQLAQRKQAETEAQGVK